MELTIILVCLILAYVSSELLRRIGMPEVIGHVLVGVLLGYQPIKEYFLGDAGADFIRILADIGLIFLLFFVGLKIDVVDFINSSKRSSLVGIFGVICPMSFGFALAYLLGVDPLPAFIIAVGISITAEAVIIDILEQLRVLEKKVSETIIEAGLIDDIISVILVTFTITLIGSDAPVSIEMGIIRILIEIMLFGFLVYIVRFYVFPFLWQYVEHEHNDNNEFMVALIIALTMAALANLFQMSSLVGAIFAGLIMRNILRSEGKRGVIEEKKITKLIEAMTFGFLAPFFFIWIGMLVDVEVLFHAPLLGILITAVGFAGKLLGAYIGNKLAGGTPMDGVIIGWGMNTRGGIDLILAGVAYEAGIIGLNIFSALVFVAFVTTIISPAVFTKLINNNRKTLV